MTTPVSWLLVQPGWRVEAADGTEVGRVEEVTGDSGADIFDGLSIASSIFAHPRYVPAEQVGEIVEGRVRLTLDRAALASSPRVQGAAGAGRRRARQGVDPEAGGDEGSASRRTSGACRSRSPRARVARLVGSALIDALALAASVRAGEVSPRELVDAAIGRIEAADPELNFLVTDCFEQARATTPADGPFAGVPMLVKDLTETAGVRTTFSSRAFADYVPQYDAAVVRRMKEAGFIVLGKSNTPEFGITCVTESDLNGACRNPWDTSRTPGGSSGGAAAAVASGVLPLAHGSDGGGSVRIPATCCGLFGLKPSRGRVSPAPFTSGSLELSQSGPLSVTVRDAAAFLDAIAGYESGDAHWAPPPERPFLDEVGADPGRLRIAFTDRAGDPVRRRPAARPGNARRCRRARATWTRRRRAHAAVERCQCARRIREDVADHAGSLPGGRRVAAHAAEPRAGRGGA